MTSAQRKRIKMKKRFRRNVKKTIRYILFAPGKLPKIRVQMLGQVIKFCEASGVMFVISLLAHLLNPDQVNTVLSIVSAGVFFLLLLIIKLEHYQEILERQEYSGG